MPSTRRIPGILQISAPAGEVAVPATGRRKLPSWQPLAAALTVTGILHFVAPKPFRGIVPRFLGNPAPWVLWSGVAEVACAAGLAAPRTRRTAAAGTAVLFVAVFPANVYAAVEAVRTRSGTRTAMLARLPFQVPLVLWALAVARQADRDRRAQP